MFPSHTIMKRSVALCLVWLAIAVNPLASFALDPRGPNDRTETPRTVTVTIPSSEIKLDGSEITPSSVMAKMNAYRAEYGLPALRQDDQLDAVAADRMTEMEDLAYWGHVSPAGREPFEMYRPHGYLYAFAGENLARGFESTGLLAQGWMESKGHRENILSTHFRDCGVAVTDGATTGPAAGKSVVVVFGTRLEQ